MEDKHYERMILKNFTRVIIPQYQEKDYKLRLFGVAIYKGRLHCQLHHKNTSLNIKESIQLDKAVREFYIDLKVESKIKGVYRFTCTANYTSGNRVMYENRKKTLELIIVKGIKNANSLYIRLVYNICRSFNYHCKEIYFWC